MVVQECPTHGTNGCNSVAKAVANFQNLDEDGIKCRLEQLSQILFLSNDIIKGVYYSGWIIITTLFRVDNIFGI